MVSTLVSQTCITFGGNKEVFPLAVIQVDTPFYKGEVQCCVVDNPVCDLILGNLPDVFDEPKLSVATAVRLVTTRARKMGDIRPTKPLTTPKPLGLDVDPLKLEKLQSEEATFRPLFAEAESSIVHRKVKGSVCFLIVNGLLYMSFVDSSGETSQLVVPSSLRETVLLTAHDSIMSGHTGITRTTKRVMYQFFWPGIRRDVRKYCQICDRLVKLLQAICA